MKRILGILLALLMLIGTLTAFSACKDEGDERESLLADETMADQGDELPENEKLDLDYTSLNYNNAEVNILQRAHLEAELRGKEGVDVSEVDQEVYERNLWLEANLGVLFNYHTVAGTVNDITEYISAVRKAALADTGDYDITSNYAYFSTQIVKEGYLANMLELPYLNEEKIWWNQSFNAVNTLNNKLYTMVGDITTSLIDETEVVFFNKELVEAHLGENYDIYNTVLEGNWTLAELERIVADIGAQDDYGTLLVGYNSSAVDGLLMGCGVQICSRDSEGRYSMSMAGDTNYTLIERLKTLVHNESQGVYGTGSQGGTNYKYNYVDSFATGKGVFFIFRMYYAREVLSSYDLEYGILPMPKASVEQDNYQCTPHDEYSALSVFNNIGSEKKEIVGAVLELMGYYSHNEIRPIVYETMYRTRYLSDPASAEIFDLIVDDTTFDFGFVWSNVLKDPVHVFRNYIWKNESGLANKVESLNADGLMEELMYHFYGEAE